MNPKGSNRAFTLIELLSVIATIAILLAILIVALGKVRKRSNAVHCASNLRQAFSAALLYANENGERLPTQGPQPGAETIYWFRKIAPYLGAPNDITVDSSEREIAAYRCPAALAEHGRGEILDNRLIRTYSLNSVLNSDGYYSDAGGENVFPGTPLSRMKHPQRTAFVMDGHLVQPQLPYWNHTTDPTALLSSVANNFVHSEHSIYVAFLDGHVANVRSEDIPERDDIFWDPSAD